MTFIEEASITILSGMLSGIHGFVENLNDEEIKHFTKLSVKIAKELKDAINIDTIENNHKTLYNDILGEKIMQPEELYCLKEKDKPT